MCRDAGVPYRGAHVFRHTFATNCYYKGIGVAKDDFEAMRWFQRAADMGNMGSRKMVDVLRKSIRVISIS